MLSTRGASLQFKTMNLSNLMTSKLVKLVKFHKQQKQNKIVKAQPSDDNGSEFVSGEWPVNWSLVSMEDCNSYYIDKSLKSELEPSYILADIMDTEIFTAKETQPISELEKFVKEIGCVPVISKMAVTSGMGLLLGVIYESDLGKQSSDGTASSIMRNPIAGKSNYSVEQAACIMLKHKISSLPIVNDSAVLIGMVNSVEIFQAMEIEAGIEAKTADI